MLRHEGSFYEVEFYSQDNFGLIETLLRRAAGLLMKVQTCFSPLLEGIIHELSPF